MWDNPISSDIKNGTLPAVCLVKTQRLGDGIKRLQSVDIRRLREKNR